MTELSNNLKVFLARELQRQFTSLDNSVALFIARTDEDASGVNSIAESNATRRQIQTARLLTDSTVSLMIPRINWTSGVIYDTYSQTADNFSRNYYVYTTEGNVYVCLGNGGGKKSIEEPTGTSSTSLVYLSNGYIWKFMYKVQGDFLDFVDDSYIPITELPIYDNKPFPYSDDKQLQYSVQYNAQSRTIDSIDVVTSGDEYTYTIKASENHVVANSTTTTITLDARASGTNDVYNDYTIRIFAGDGAGQFRRITDYNGSTKVATLESLLTESVTSNSKYEIIPTIQITGDGINGTAYAKMRSYNSNTIDSVVVASSGSNYTTATATALPTGNGTVLSVQVNPSAALGRDPLFDLFARRLSILTRFEGRESEKAVLGNDYRQFGLWLSPKINGGFVNSGRIAGTDTYLRTKIDIETTGTSFDREWAESNDFVFGNESYAMGRVSPISNPFVQLSPTRGQITLDGLERPFKEGETLYTFKSDQVASGFTFTSKTATVINTLFADSTRASFQDTYRCSHRLAVSRTDGLSFDFSNPSSDIPYDSGVTGASGGVGIVLELTNVVGGSGDLFVTKVVAPSSNVVGFTGGETLATNDGVSTLELSIDSVSPPELDLFSGELLYITSVERVTRNTEQIDLFKINFDF